MPSGTEGNDSGLNVKFLVLRTKEAAFLIGSWSATATAELANPLGKLRPLLVGHSGVPSEFTATCWRARSSVYRGFFAKPKNPGVILLYC